MSKIGDMAIRVCSSMRHFPSFVLCILIIVIQASTLDYYLIHHLNIQHSAWIICDVIVLILFITCFVLSYRLEQNRKYFIVWITWLTLQLFLSAKVIVICININTGIDDEKSSFFGPNTLKTAIALSSCIFVLFLTSQHDSPLGSERRRFIEGLTGTVIFDILDTTDILEILFDKDKLPLLPVGLADVVLAVATLNLLLPTVPVITLSKTRFGLEKLQKKVLYWHRLLVVLAVNVPNLVLRMVMWHVYSVAVSPFTLKNLIVIFMMLHEFYEHKKETYEKHERVAVELEEKRNCSSIEQQPGETTKTNGDVTDETSENRHEVTGSLALDSDEAKLFLDKHEI